MDARKKFTLNQLDNKHYPDSEDNYAIFLINLYMTESRRTGFAEVQLIIDHIKNNLYVDEIPKLATRLLTLAMQGYRGHEFTTASKELCEEIIKEFWR